VGSGKFLHCSGGNPGSRLDAAMNAEIGPLAPSPDLKAARTLFQSLNQIHLVAIIPDGPAYGRVFGRDVSAATAWALQENESGRNIYFTVNEVEPGCHKKPVKSEIVAARFCHVDIDPPTDGGPWDKNLKLATLLNLSCPPIVCS
jgi:hypothetical protein